MKELFMEMIEDSLAPWKEEELILGNLEKEEFSTVKNGIETVVTAYFTKTGYPVKIKYKYDKVLSEKEKKAKNLQRLIDEAVLKKDYKEAAKLQEELQKL